MSKSSALYAMIDLNGYSAEVREEVARNTSAPVDLLTRLAKDKDSQVRRAADSAIDERSQN